MTYDIMQGSGWGKDQENNVFSFGLLAKVETTTRQSLPWLSMCVGVLNRVDRDPLLPPPSPSMHAISFHWLSLFKEEC